MWILSVLLFLPFSKMLMADKALIDLSSCMAGRSHKPDLMNAAGEDIESICRKATNAQNCVDKEVEDKTGFTIEDLAHMLSGTETGKSVQVLLNTKILVRDICTNGSDLNKKYKEAKPCFDNLSRSNRRLFLKFIYAQQCMKKAVEAYEAYIAVEEERGVYGQSDRECMVGAYKTVCEAAYYNRDCGESAFAFHHEMIKRSGLYRILLCSPEALENLKTKFLDSLDMDENKKAIYRAGFDLRKKRK